MFKILGFFPILLKDVGSNLVVDVRVLLAEKMGKTNFEVSKKILTINLLS
jgi:hypothetical protein